MQPPRSSTFDARWINWLEWLVASGLTLAAIVLQVTNWRYAGGLWRDEAAAVNLAQMRSWPAVWANLEHESFPLLLTIVIRVWTAIGLGETDAALRALGLLITCGLLATLWFSAWRLSRRPPLLSLLLIGLSPVALRWGGSLRAYGLGVILALLTIAAVWHLTEAVARKRIIIAALISIGAVHTLYQNALIVLAVTLAGGAVAMMRRDWKLGTAVAAVGGIAALSLLPYFGVIKRASEWNKATEVAIDISRIWTVLHRALAAPGAWMPWLWVATVIAAATCALVHVIRRSEAHDREARDVLLFLSVTAAITTVAYYTFIRVTRFPTEEWYYLLWISVGAVITDAILSRCACWRVRASRAVVIAVAAVLAIPHVSRALHVRATNVDLIAGRLNAAVSHRDLVLVHPWFCSVSFHRYYTGSTRVMTIPPLADHKLQRLDLLKEQMRSDKPLAPLLGELEATLRTGGTVWLIGYFPFSNPPRPPPTLPRAGEGPEGWRAAPYMTAYAMEVAYFVQMNASRSEAVHVPSAQTVHPFEDLPLRTVSGWRHSPSL